MSSWKKEWSDLSKQMTQLKEDCFHFDIVPPEFGNIVTIEKELSEAEEMWQLFEDFDNKLLSFEKLKWLDFRKELFQFQDFYLS